MGCAGHGNGLYLLDRAGAPLLAIQSLDSRAAALADELRADGNGARLHAHLPAGAMAVADADAARLGARAMRPKSMRSAGTAFLCKDFVTFRLTGRRVSRHLRHERRRPAPTARLPLRRRPARGLRPRRCLRMLPDLLRPTEIAGRVTAEAAAATGLAEGTPVVAGLFDVVASALGSGVVDEGQASIIAGTWSINQVIARPADRRPPRLHGLGLRPRIACVAIESSATSAANLEWYVREFMERGASHDDPFGACNRRVAAVTPAADDPFFHPFLYGSRLGASMRAGFYGIAGWHGEGHMLRALFEGVAFEHRRHVDVLRAAGVRFDSASLSGGGARSAVWPQMFADVLGDPGVGRPLRRDRRARSRDRRRGRRRDVRRSCRRPCAQ